MINICQLNIILSNLIYYFSSHWRIINARCLVPEGVRRVAETRFIFIANSPRSLVAFDVIFIRNRTTLYDFSIDRVSNYAVSQTIIEKSFRSIENRTPGSPIPFFFRITNLVDRRPSSSNFVLRYFVASILTALDVFRTPLFCYRI